MSLRDAIAAPGIVVAPGVYDALSAAVAESVGFQALYLSGVSIACTRLGRPDIGLVAMSEVADTLSAIRERVEVPLVVDAGTGFGNALNVQRTVRLFERRGAAALQFEDRTMPKRCGDLNGKILVSTAEMVGKVKAATDARKADTLIIACTDAIAVEGLHAALDRAEACLDAGADMLFVNAPQDEAQMAAICKRFRGRAPVMANMVEGGTTPRKSAAELAALGFGLVIFPGGTVRAVAKLLTDYYTCLRENGTTAPFGDAMLNLGGLNDLLGTDDMLEQGRAYGAAGFEDTDAD